MQLYPIPKTYDWNYSLIHARQILLIECLRERVIKILMSRVLTDLNFTGLPGESNQDPLIIINSLLKDAREQDRRIFYDPLLCATQQQHFGYVLEVP